MNGYERAQKSILLERLEEAPQRLIIITGTTTNRQDHACSPGPSRKSIDQIDTCR